MSLIVALAVPGTAALAGEPAGGDAGEDNAGGEQASDEDEDSEEVFKTVVTATRFDDEKGNVPASVTVIDGEEAKKRPFLTADELIRTEASMTGRRHQGLGNTYPHVLSFRGLEGIDRVLVLLDGLTVNNGLTGSANLNLLPTDDILRVELLRGPFSVLYGSHAMGGVLHVITIPGGKEPGLRLKADVGMFDAVHAAARAAGRLGEVEAALRYDVRTTDNYLGDGAEKNLDYLHHNLNARIDLFRGSAVSLKITGGYFASDTGFNQYVDLRNYGMNLYFRNEGRNTKDNGYSQVALRWKPHKTLVLKGSTGFMYQAQSFFAVPVILDGEFPWEEYDIQKTDLDGWRVRMDAIAKWNPLGWLETIAGFEQTWDIGNWDVFHYEGGSLVTGMDARTSTTALFMQAAWNTLADTLRVIGGIRVDRHSTFGFAFSPKVGVNIKPHKSTIIRGSYGRAFRAPSLSELYCPAWVRIPPYFTIGNEDLDPETVDAVDMGVEQRIGSVAVVRATGFHNLGKNFIQLRLQPAGYEQYVNISRVRTAGLELESEISWSEYLHLRLSYTYTWSEDISTGEPLEYVPEHMAGLSVQGNIPAGPVSIIPAFDVSFVGERWYSEVRAPENRDTLDPHVVGSARLQVRWKMLGFFIDLRNLWNMDYEETAYIRAPRFLLFGGISMETGLPV